MLLFLIPVIVLAGATSIGIAAELTQGAAPGPELTATNEVRPAPPTSTPAPKRTP